MGAKRGQGAGEKLLAGAQPLTRLDPPPGRGGVRLKKSSGSIKSPILRLSQGA